MRSTHLAAHLAVLGPCPSPKQKRAYRRWQAALADRLVDDLMHDPAAIDRLLSAIFPEIDNTQCQ